MINDNYSRFFLYTNRMGWKLLMLAGLSFILFGLLIILVPQIFIVLAAGLFFFIGLTILINAWHLRKQDSSNQRTIRIRWYD